MLEWVSLGYLGLFLASFLAATILPFSSEALLSFMLLKSYSFETCILVATLGNTLGGMTSYYLGLLGKWSWLEKYFKITQKQVEYYQAFTKRFQVALAFFTWLPIIGDALAVCLGYMRLSWRKVCFWMLVGKACRYLVLGYWTLKLAN